MPEMVHRLGPWKSIEMLELETLNWVTWFNQNRLLEPIGNIPPVEFEAQCQHSQHDIRNAA